MKLTNRYDIFLSYRRCDGKDIARAMKETLERRGYKVFLDMDELQDGVFDKRILDAIQSAPIYLILLTPHCLDRCDRETDWVRQEIDYALKHRKQIIPINPDKQFAGFPSNIPDHIRRGLSQHQYSAIDTGQLYQVSMEQLISRRLQPVFRKKKIHWSLLIMAILAVVLLGCYGYYRYYAKHQPQIYYQKACIYNHVGEATYNRDSALYYLNQAAEMDYAPAQRDLGLLYQFSIDLNNHAEWSYYWLKKAYLNGDTLAVALLGYNYEYGIGIPQDMGEAIDLYKEGVEQSDAYAYYLLGQCMLNGKGMAKDEVEGTRMIAQSAKLDDPWGKLYMQDAGRWIFYPACDSLSSPYISLRAICLSDTSTSLYFRWNNEQYVGGWMQINREARIEDPVEETRYGVRWLTDCCFAPDTTQVAWGTSHDFVLHFPAVSANTNVVNFQESDTSCWKVWGISLR